MTIHLLLNSFIFFFICIKSKFTTLHIILCSQIIHIQFNQNFMNNSFVMNLKSVTINLLGIVTYFVKRVGMNLSKESRLKNLVKMLHVYYIFIVY